MTIIIKINIGRSWSWPKSKVAEVDIGRSRKSKLAEVEGGCQDVLGTRARKKMGRRLNGIRRAHLELRLIEAKYLGQHARTGALIGITTDVIVLGVDCPMESCTGEQAGPTACTL